MRTGSRGLGCCGAGPGVRSDVERERSGGRSLFGCGAGNAAGLLQAFLMSGTEAARCGGDYVGVESLAEVERWLVEWG